MSLTKIRKSNIESNVRLPHANAAFDTANSSGVYANAAFAAANNAVDTWVRDASNSASSYANSAYSEANNKLSLSGGTLTGNLVVAGNVMPTTDNVYYLGSESVRWHSLYVGDGSIYIGDIVLSNDANKLAITDSIGNKVTISSNNIVLGDFVLSSTGAITGDVVITGNLSVTGTLADLQVTGLVIDDNIIDINEATLGVPTLNAGVRVKRGDENAVLLRWNETNDRWEFTNDGSAYSNIASAAAESYANASYDTANVADQRAVTSGSYANSGYSAANTADQKAVSAGDYANSAYAHSNTRLSSSGGTIDGNLTVTGNLVISGNTTTVDVETLRISDPIILLANNNTTDLVDVGFTAHYGATEKHTGLLRHAPTQEYYLFDNYDGHILHQNNSVDISNSDFRIVTLNANLKSNTVVVRGIEVLDRTNSSYSTANVAGVYANAAFEVANTPSNVANSASSYANGAFVGANTADQKAVTSGSYANAAYGLANTANTLAQSAYDAANNATDTWVRNAANSASSYANSAYIHANAAFTVANTGGGGGGGSTVTINSAPPASGNVSGDVWIDSSDGTEYTWIEDGDSSQWVELGPFTPPANTSSISSNNTTITGNLLPQSTEIYNLGSSNNKWKDLYLSGNTIFLGNTSISSSNNDLVLPANTKIGTGDTSLPTAGAFSFRNKIINGNFDIWQRGTSQTSSGYGSADRWSNLNTGSTKTASRQSFTLGQTDVPNNPKYFLRHVVTSVAGASNFVVSLQKIEGVETFAGKTATLSFWAKADASKNIAIEFEQDFGTGGSPSSIISGISSQLISLTTSWTKYTVTVNIPSITGKTLGTNGTDYLNFLFWFDAGSSFNSRSASLGQQSGTFDIAEVQLEEGSVATPFEQRPIATEMNLCTRYFYRMGNNINAFLRYAVGDVRLSTEVNGVIYLPNVMRATPIATVSSAGHFAISEANTNRTVTAFGISTMPENPAFIFYNASVASGLTPGRCAQLISNNTTASFIDFSAEL